MVRSASAVWPFSPMTLPISDLATLSSNTFVWSRSISVTTTLSGWSTSAYTIDVNRAFITSPCPISIDSDTTIYNEPLRYAMIIKARQIAMENRIEVTLPKKIWGGPKDHPILVLNSRSAFAGQFPKHQNNYILERKFVEHLKST